MRIARGEAGVAIKASIVPLSHSRASTRPVSIIPVIVSTMTISPGTRYLRLSALSLNQMRGTVAAPAACEFFTRAIIAAAVTALPIITALGASMPSIKSCAAVAPRRVSSTSSASTSKAFKAFSPSAREVKTVVLKTGLWVKAVVSACASPVLASCAIPRRTSRMSKLNP